MSKVHEFEGRVRVDGGVEKGYMKHFVPVPRKVAAALGSGARVLGSLFYEGFEVEFRRVLSETTEGAPCLKFGEGWLRDEDLHVNDSLRVRLQRDPDPDHVPLPDALALALEATLGAEARWTALTPGKKRTLVYGIERAKRPETKHRRAAAVVETLMSR